MFVGEKFGCNVKVESFKKFKKFKFLALKIHFFDPSIKFTPNSKNH